MLKLIYNEKFRQIKDKAVLYSFAALCCMSLFSESTLIVTDNVSSAALNILVYTINYFIVANLLADKFLYKNRYTWLTLLLILLSVAVFIYAKDNSFFFCIIFITVLSKYNLKDIARIVFWPMFISFLIIVFLSLTRIIPDFTYSRGEGLIRYSLGFYYPTIASTAYLFIISIRIYSLNFALSFFELLVHGAFTVGIYAYTDSRTGFLLCALALIICFAYKLFFRNIKNKFKCDSRIIKGILTALPILSCAVYLLFTLLYYLQVDFAYVIDGFLSERLHYTVKGFTAFPISIVGAIVHMNGWGGYGYTVSAVENYDYNYIDNGFMQIFFRFGVCTFVAVLLVYTLIMHKAVKDKNFSFIVIFIVVLINCMIEPNLLYYTRNIFILYSSSFIYRYIDKPALSYKYSDLIVDRSCPSSAS